MVAASLGRESTVRKLLDLGANPLARNMDKKTASDFAHGHPAVLELLEAALSEKQSVGANENEGAGGSAFDDDFDLDQTISFSEASLLSMAQPQHGSSSEDVRVMSFNIRYGDNVDRSLTAWPRRRSRVASTIRFHRPDVIGLQEVMAEQLDDLKIMLPQWSSVGVGRTDGGREGEHVPVLFRHDRLQLLASDTLWLSPSPREQGSKVRFVLIEF